MLEDLDKVIAALKYWGLKPDIKNSYSWRFFIQKTTYLLEAFDMPISYFFTIHLKGTYSRQLTQDYYAFQDRVCLLETNYVPTPKDIEIFERMKKTVLERTKTPDDADAELQLLEGISTAVYLMRQSPETVGEEVFATIKILKPYLSDATVVIGLSIAKEVLFKPEYLTDEIQEEIEIWDRVDQ